MAKLNIKAENENGKLEELSANENIRITFNQKNKVIAKIILADHYIEIWHGDQLSHYWNANLSTIKQQENHKHNKLCYMNCMYKMIHSEQGKKHCQAQVGEHLCQNLVYKNDYCRKHFEMFDDNQGKKQQGNIAQEESEENRYRKA